MQRTKNRVRRKKKKKKKKKRGRMNMGVVGVAALVVVLASVLIDGTAAENYTVGGDLNWAVPPNTTAYSTWAATITFRVGDTLVFNFTTGQHNVEVVHKDDYDNCTSSDPIASLTTGPASYYLNSTGDHYFLCSVGDHCSKGQKLSISVSNSSTGSPSPAPSSGDTPSPAPPPPATSSPSSPPNNSAGPLAAATFSALIFTAMAMALITW